jgi:two-component system LytT family response regulator
MEQKLKPHGFLRIHRSTLVNKDRISELRALDNGEYDVLMQDGTQLKLSRNYRAALQEILAGKSL